MSIGIVTDQVIWLCNSNAAGVLEENQAILYIAPKGNGMTHPGSHTGLTASEAFEKRYGKEIKRAEKWIDKHGIFPVLVLFSATPLPSDIVGALAGMVEYDVKGFLLATLIGRTIAYLLLAFAGFYGMSYVLSLFGG